MTRRSLRWLVLPLVAAGMVLAAGLGWWAGLRHLEGAVLRALGPQGEIASMSMGLGGVELRGVRVRAPSREGPSGWPTDHELRADRIHITPDLASAWQAVRGHGAWRIRRVQVEGGELTLHRGRDGRLRVLPSLGAPRPRAVAASRPAPAGATNYSSSAAQAQPAPRNNGPGADLTADAPAAVIVDHIELRGVELLLFDASVRRPAHRLHLTGLTADIGPLHWPALDVSMRIDGSAVFQGPERGRDGRLTLAGQITPATGDATLRARVSQVDLRSLQPYLLKVGEGGVRRGTLDMTLDATVKNRQLHAPGELVLTGLELGRGGGLLGTFAGVPRQAVLAAMQRDGRIALSFTLHGCVDDPAFSLRDSLVAEVGVGLARALGVSMGGVVEGVGGLLRGLLGR